MDGSCWRPPALEEKLLTGDEGGGCVQTVNMVSCVFLPEANDRHASYSWPASVLT